MQEKVSNRLGFYYTKRDKTWLIHNAVKTMKVDKPQIHSRRLLQEMRGFLQITLDEWGPSPDCKYDDVVNAYMLAILGATDERPRFIKPTPQVVSTAADRPWACHDIDADLDDPAHRNSYIERVLSIQ